MKENLPQSLHQRLIGRMMASRFFTVSLLIHVGLISLLGGVVLFQATRQQDNFVAVGTSDGFLTEQPAEPSEAPGETAEFAEPAEAAAVTPTETVSPASAITSLTDSSASWSTSAPSDYAAFGNTLGSSRPLSSGTGTGSGRSRGSGGTGGGSKMGTLFGVKIEAQKLGVVLDVSGSAHPFLVHALKEIDKSFKGAPTVLYVGCGMAAEAQAKDYDVKRARSVANDMEKPNNILVFNILNALMRQNADDGDYIKRLLRGKDVFLTITEGKTPPTVGCQFALEKLIEEKVDTIYWFADFTDKIDPVAAQEMAAKLQVKGIKVIAHNFAGKPVHPAAMTIVKATGGQAITAVPGK